MHDNPSLLACHKSYSVLSYSSRLPAHARERGGGPIAGILRDSEHRTNANVRVLLRDRDAAGCWIWCTLPRCAADGRPHAKFIVHGTRARTYLWPVASAQCAATTLKLVLTRRRSPSCSWIGYVSCQDPLPPAPVQHARSVYARVAAQRRRVDRQGCAPGRVRTGGESCRPGESETLLTCNLSGRSLKSSER
jgi:hypothetical protein